MVDINAFIVGIYLANAVLLTAISQWGPLIATDHGSKYLRHIYGIAAAYSFSIALRLGIHVFWVTRVVMVFDFLALSAIILSAILFIHHFIDNVFSERTITGLKIFFGILAVLSATNPVTHLVFWNLHYLSHPIRWVNWNIGPLFAGVVLITQLLILFGIFRLVRSSATSNDTIRRQVRYLAAGYGTIIIFSLITVTGALYLDVTPFAFTFLGLMMVGAVLRQNLFGVRAITYPEVFDQLAESVIILDDENRVFSINSAAESLFHASTEDIVGSDAETVLPDEIVQVRERQYQSENGVELPYDDETYQVVASPISIGRDDTTGVALILNDITTLVEQRNSIQEQHSELQMKNNQLEEQQIELELQKEQLEEKTTELERQNDRLDKFAGTVSHDLRNPLNTAQMYTDMAEEMGDPEQFDTIRSSLDRMEQIVDDVLALARDGQTVDKTREVSVETVAERAWDSISVPDVSCTVDAPVTVDCDPERLQTVFENLFRNAEEHNDDAVDIMVGVLDSEEGVYVADTGSGVPESEREKVFEHGHTTNENGTGFGLSIVSEIVAAHGWEISVTESASGGAQFNIQFET